MKFVTYKNKIFLVDDGVLEPKKDAFFFYEHIVASKNDVVLDIGTGTGFYAIMIADKVKHVVSTDIDIRAVKNACKNVVLNGLEDKVEVLHGDMFEPVKGKKFDMVVCSLPQMPTPEWKIKEKIKSLADDGGIDGRELINRFIKSLKRYLDKNGRAYLFHFDFLDANKTIKMFKEEGLAASVIASLECPPGRLTSERICHLNNLGFKLNRDVKTGDYTVKIDVIRALRK